jgi:HEAT repeat protein
MASPTRWGTCKFGLKVSDFQGETATRTGWLSKVPSMKTHVLLVTGLLVLLVSGVPLWRWSHSYQGKTADQWFALAMRDSDNLQRYSGAFRGLGHCGAAYLANVLTRQPPPFASTYDLVRLKVSRVLKIPPLPFGPARPAEIQCAKKLLGYLETNAVPALIRGLNRGPASSRKFVVQALGELGPAAADQAGPALARCLQDPSAEILSESIASLGMVQYRPKAIVPRLVLLLKHSDRRVRVEASYAIGNYLPLPELTLEPLQAALEDSDRVVRANAARALGRMGTNALPAVGKLREQLKDGMLPAVRAAEALTLICPAAGANADQGIERALEAAQSSGNSYFNLIALSSRQRRFEDAGGLAEACLRQLSMRSEPYQRWEAVEYLWASGIVDTNAASVLRRGSEDSNGLVRYRSRTPAF